MARETEFWTSNHRYEDLAREYEQNIDVTYPSSVTSNGVGHRFSHHSMWCASNVKYYEYTGSKITSI